MAAAMPKVPRRFTVRIGFAEFFSDEVIDRFDPMKERSWGESTQMKPFQPRDRSLIPHKGSLF
jgi:hypothetical protein